MKKNLKSTANSINTQTTSSAPQTTLGQKLQKILKFKKAKEAQVQQSGMDEIAMVTHQAQPGTAKPMASSASTITPPKGQKGNVVHVRNRTIVKVVRSTLLTIILLLVVREAFPQVADSISEVYKLLDEYVLPIVNWMYKFIRTALDNFMKNGSQIKDLFFKLVEILENAVGM